MEMYTKTTKTGRIINVILYNEIEWRQYQKYYTSKLGRLQRYIWEEHYGSIPQHSDIYFKSGDCNDFDINNIECKSHSQHTSVHQRGVKENYRTKEHNQKIAQSRKLYYERKKNEK